MIRDDKILLKDGACPLCKRAIEPVSVHPDIKLALECAERLADDKGSDLQYELIAKGIAAMAGGGVPTAHSGQVDNPPPSQQPDDKTIEKALANAAVILANFKPEKERDKLEEWQACYAMLFKQMNDLVASSKRESFEDKVQSEWEKIRGIPMSEVKVGMKLKSTVPSQYRGVVVTEITDKGFKYSCTPFWVRAGDLQGDCTGGECYGHQNYSLYEIEGGK